MNLLQETLDAIKAFGHCEQDIIFIGSEESGHSCSWDEFKVLADFEYFEGFGAQKVAYDLIIVFKDGSKMWRHEYDGSERWDFSTPFVPPKELKPIARLVVTDEEVGWRSLKELNSTKLQLVS